jgi:GNAT superfamily N-acetyltransferase
MTTTFVLQDKQEILIRPITKKDSFAELTELLHRAYAAPVEEGIVFYASHQTIAETRERVNAGHCFVGTRDNILIATITIYNQHREKCEWYNRPGVWFFGQFAVEPSLQRGGLGAAMIRHIERFAKKNGATDLACDTAENAEKLIHYYTTLGFRQVGRVKWDGVEHHSVVLSKGIR